MACKESGGGSLALRVASTAGRTACLCKECGGNGICEHGRVRTSGFWGTIPSYADAPARCGLFANDDFTAKQMCCACGGGDYEGGAGDPSASPSPSLSLEVWPPVWTYPSRFVWRGLQKT